MYLQNARFRTGPRAGFTVILCTLTIQLKYLTTFGKDEREIFYESMQK